MYVLSGAQQPTSPQPSCVCKETPPSLASELLVTVVSFSLAVFVVNYFGVEEKARRSRRVGLVNGIGG